MREAPVPPAARDLVTRRGVTLRTRLAAVVAVAVALAVLVAVGVAWLATEHRLRAEVDDALVTRSGALADLPALAALSRRTDPGAGGDDRPGRPRSRYPGIRAALVRDLAIQVVGVDGQVISLAGAPLPVGEAERAVAATGGADASVTDADVDGAHFRVSTQAIAGGGAVQVGRDVTETDHTLDGLALLLAITAAVGVGAATLVGLVVAKRALRPVDRLSEAAERVARDQDLTAPLPAPTAHDEVGRLTESFNTMLAALATSREQQQRLVTDASHELRTPLTSLRTTIELLRRADRGHPPSAAAGPGLPAAQRRELYDHALDELSELTHLATELVDLATEVPAVTDAAQTVDLGHVADRVAARARRRTGQSIAVTIENRASHRRGATDDDPTRAGDPRLRGAAGDDATRGGSVVVGHAAPIERAVANLVDNACKWNPLGATIEVTVARGRVTVRDHGPGVPPDERDRVFERFARGAGTQAVPGSGLGLAIVRQVAVEHGGRAWLEAAPGGGTLVVVEFSGDSQGS